MEVTVPSARGRSPCGSRKLGSFLGRGEVARGWDPCLGPLSVRGKPCGSFDAVGEVNDAVGDPVGQAQALELRPLKHSSGVLSPGSFSSRDPKASDALLQDQPAAQVADRKASAGWSYRRSRSFGPR